jgi:membrane-associated protease RseP (regulator of RpoE activity)
VTGPKHLWSGDWERESELSRWHAHPKPPPAADSGGGPPVAAARPREDRLRAQLRGRRRLAVILSVLGLGIAGVAYGAVTVSADGSRPRADPALQNGDAPVTVTAPTRTFSVPARTGSAPTQANGIRQTRWLGMTIVTGVVSRAVVESVAARSPGERAGVRPGDEILSIAGHPVSGSTSLVRALGLLHAGERLTLRVAHGTVTRGLHVTIGASATGQS